MSHVSKIALVQEMLESAESSLRSAKQLLTEVASGSSSPTDRYASKAAQVTTGEQTLGKIIEGVFDGQNMVGPDKRSYPVPANYASKSKLVPGDVLKLTITDSGQFIYKQIGPVPRRQTVGTLVYEDGQYKVIAEGKAFRVLLASVTYFKAEVGDKVSIIIPEASDGDWGAIENIIPVPRSAILEDDKE